MISSFVAVTPSKILSSSVEAVTPSRIFISSAVAVTSVSANLRPPSIPSCDAIFNIWFSSVPPIVIIPDALWVTTFPLEDCPTVILSNDASDALFIVTPPTTIPVSAVIVPVAVTLRNPAISFVEFNTTAFSPTATPCETPSR